MCQKGVNTDQLKVMMGMAEDAIALAQQWLEQIHHLADHAELTDSSAAIAQATVLLGEARARLDDAGDEIVGHDHGNETSVELV